MIGILTQRYINRRDAETLRSKIRMAAKNHTTRKIRSAVQWLLFSLCLSVSAVILSCGSKPTDMRSLVPAETLVYLETNDLAGALQSIVDAKPFREVAKSKPDFSALNGVQLAVAVTGFETSEETLTDEHSVGRVQPHFVAVADTHAWNYQAVKFAELKLGSFVTEIYDSEPTLEKTNKNNGKYFIWTAKDGRKAYALVIDALIYFGNDESAIDKCLAVKRGEADSIAKAGKVKPAGPATLASGYVSTDGVAQIANIAGLKFATEAGEDSEIRSAIAGILPQLIRNSVTDISWISAKTEQGIEDKYQVTMPPDITKVLGETMAPSDSSNDADLFLPTSLDSVTIYNLKNSQVALRSLLLTVSKVTNPLVGKVFAEVVSLTFEGYGIRDPEVFLGSLGSSVAVARFATRDRSAIIATVNDQKATESALSESIKPLFTPTADSRVRSWHVDGQGFTAVIENNRIFIGDESVASECGVAVRDKRPTFSVNQIRAKGASIVSIGKDTTTTLSLIEMLAREGHGDTQAVSTYLTETRFSKTGMERKTTSDFGLIGSIIAQLSEN